MIAPGNRVSGPDLIAALAGVWVIAASILISHFRFYYGAGWENAIKWGVGDGFLWGVLSCALIYAYQHYLADKDLSRSRLFYISFAVFSAVIIHPVLVVIFYWSIDGTISRPFIENVLHLVIKRYPQGILAGLLIGLGAISIATLSKKGRKTAEAPCVPPISQAKRSPWFLLKDATGIRRVSVCDISYVEAAGNYVALHTVDGEYLERATLKSVEMKLNEQGFFRISRKHLVNLSHIQSIESVKPKGSIVILSDQTGLPVSRNYKSALQDALAYWLKSKIGQDI